MADVAATLSAWDRVGRLCSRLALLSLVATLASCSETKSEVWRIDGRSMGTFYHITIVVPPGAHSALLSELTLGITQRLVQVEQAMSTYLEDSEVSRFNRVAVATWFPVSSATVRVVSLAQEIAVSSGGAFDITVGELVELWGFGATPAPAPRQPPAPASLSRAREALGYQYLEWRAQPPALRKQRPLHIDLSAIAKGYAVDQVADYLYERGLQHYLVEVGGELRAQGKNANGKAWRLGIERPDAAPGTVQRAININDAAVATSGDYRNFYLWQGQRYSHSMNPHLGRPVRHALASVTVIAQRAARADALATALYVLGPDAGRQLAEQHELAAFFIIRSATDTWEEYATPAMTQLLSPP